LDRGVKIDLAEHSPTRQIPCSLAGTGMAATRMTSSDLEKGDRSMCLEACHCWASGHSVVADS
jgi:hypothetical protein